MTASDAGAPRATPHTASAFKIQSLKGGSNLILTLRLVFCLHFLSCCIYKTDFTGWHLKFSFLQTRHTYICDDHKTMIQCARTKQRRPKDSEDDSNEAEMDSPEVDWFQLQVSTLRRYKRHYKVTTKPGLNKQGLADVSMQIAQ